MGNFERAIPILRMEDASVAERFYCEILGFTRRSLFFPNPAKPAPAYLTVEREGVYIHLSSFEPNQVGSAYFDVVDVDALFAELSRRGVQCQMSPVDQTWGMREIALRDPVGNCLTFGAPIDEERTQRAVEREQRM